MLHVKGNVMWKPIKNFEGLYEISSDGRVRSLHKRNYHNILNTWDNGRGYLFCNLCKKGQKKKHGYIHKLVAGHFVDNPDTLNVVNHIDGDRSNNDYTNLEWCDQSHNMKHASEMNLIHKGEKCFRSKLKNEDVLEIRRLNEEYGTKPKEIAEMFNIDSSHASRIINRKVWKHI